MNRIIPEGIMNDIKILNHYDVVSLEELSIFAIVKLIINLATTALDTDTDMDRIQKFLLSKIPYYLYDEVAAHLIKTVQNLTLSAEQSFGNEDLNDLNRIVRLTDIIFTPTLKRLKLLHCPELVRYHVSNNLSKLSGLEVLDLGVVPGQWSMCNENTNMIEGIKVMKNLKKFCLHHHCNDEMVKALGDNCTKLEVLDVTSSLLVTDESMRYLIKCNKLISIQLYNTSVTMNVFSMLIVDLPHLRDIGRYIQLDDVFKYIFEHSLLHSALEIRKFETIYLSPECLENLVKMCPNLEYIGLYHNSQKTKLSLLTSFNNLKQVKLSGCSFYKDSVCELLKSRGLRIHTLHLEKISDLNFNAIFVIGESCPNLRILILKDCQLIDEPERNSKFNVKPFQNLEYLFWQVKGPYANLKYILSFAINIKSIKGFKHAFNNKLYFIN